MRSCIDVARLTRPARIRCRPALFYRLYATTASSPDRHRVYQSRVASDHEHRARYRRSLSTDVEDVTQVRVKPKNEKRLKEEDDFAPGQDTAVILARKRRDQADYEQAKSLKDTRRSRMASTSSSPASSSALPSLRNPKSFLRNRQSANSASKTVAAADTESSFNEPHNQAGPSRLPASAGVARDAALTSTSRLDKGKGKATDRTATHPIRRNPAGVQLLSASLHQQLFPGKNLPKPPRQLVQLSQQHLKANGLDPGNAAKLEEINFEMPPLQGINIRDHFHALGQSEAEPYLSMAHHFAEVDLPPMPEVWVTDWPGWSKYHADGTVEHVDDLGDETIVSFDVEVLYKLSPYPVIATAATPNGWYSWLCPTIFEAPPKTPIPDRPKWDKTLDSRLPHSLIPMFKGDQGRIVLGHNVGYDRARIKDEYTLEATPTRFIDTLSLHVATRGITSVQRPAWMKHKQNKREKAADAQGLKEATLELLREHVNPDWADALSAMESEPEDAFAGEEEGAEGTTKWEDITSTNSLKEVAALHCGYTVDKTIRDRFGDDSISHPSQLRPELHDLIQYCADDVKTTHDVFKKVFPLFIESCPHPASFAGALGMGNAILPVDKKWKEYIKNAEETYKKMDVEVGRSLRALAEKLRLEGPKEDDPWSLQLDWSPKKARWTESGPNAPPAAVEAVSAARALLETPGSSGMAPTSGHTSASRPIFGVGLTPEPINSNADQRPINSQEASIPAWYQIYSSEDVQMTRRLETVDIALLLRMTYQDNPVVYLKEHGWCFRARKADAERFTPIHGSPVEPSDSDKRIQDWTQDCVFFRIAPNGKPKKNKLGGPGIKRLIKEGLSSPYLDLLLHLVKPNLDTLLGEVPRLTKELKETGLDSPWAVQLDQAHSIAKTPQRTTSASSPVSVKKGKSTSSAVGETWPAWYWDLTKPISQLPPGELDLTQKKTVTPLLLRLQWEGYPLFLSRNYRWLYQVPKTAIKPEHLIKGNVVGHGKPIPWDEDELKSGDESLQSDDEHYYFRIPHSGGEGKNVGNPLGKGFVKSLENGKLSCATEGDDAAGSVARQATQMNVLCSYWISARERIMDQMVVYDSPKSGLILPQVVTMGTVTRRAVEGTWLTASNAKKNRVGSELKAMVRAPPGYAIVGADVDSEELWISSVMGDSQFGMHGATAIGWMTLEGTKSAGTDLHSKTASILGTSRDAAKVFNYSRIYGAGVKHAVQLLMQGDASLTKEEATAKAKALYTATKGEKSQRDRRLPPAAQPTLWHGGSESFLFNTLEAIALSDRPTTPALGCGVTKALSRSYLDSLNTYLPSRINWVVQSSGVDYLHLLIVSMSYLIKRYNIKARYLLSVHDEVRYLSKEEDKHRTALALQIANAWTRALFCYNLGIDDVPQGVTFFSAVDIDHVLRKEVNMPCITPSHPAEIPSGVSLTIDELLPLVPGASLGEPIGDGIQVNQSKYIGSRPPVTLFPEIDSTSHYMFLKAQTERQGLRAKLWLDRQESRVDGQGEAMAAPAEKSGKKAKGAKIERLRRATSHLAGDADVKDVLDALKGFEDETRSKRKM